MSQKSAERLYLQASFGAVRDAAKRVGTAQADAGMAVDVDGFMASFRPDLIEVVAMWATGAPFLQVRSNCLFMHCCQCSIRAFEPVACRQHRLGPNSPRHEAIFTADLCSCCMPQTLSLRSLLLPVKEHAKSMFHSSLTLVVHPANVCSADQLHTPAGLEPRQQHLRGQPRARLAPTARTPAAAPRRHHRARRPGVRGAL